jgi:hypothetical protein
MKGDEMSDIITPKEIAADLYLDAKTVRNAMRRLTDRDGQPGSGGRWNIERNSDFHVALVAHLQRVNGNKKVVVAQLRSDLATAPDSE